MNPIDCNAQKPPRITYFIASAWTINCLAYSIIYPFIPLYLHQDRGIPMAKVGTIFPLMGLAGILAPPLWGYLTDRFGRRPLMQLGQYGRAVIFLGLAVAAYFQAPFSVFAALLMLSTAVGAAFQVSANSYLADITNPDNRTISFGRISIGCNVGWAFGPMLGAFFAKTPFWLFFIMTGLLCLAGTVYTKVSCCDRQVNAAEKKAKKHSSGSILPDIFGNRNFMLYMLGTLFLMCLASQLYSTFSVFSTTVAGVSREALGSIYSLNGAMVLLLQLPVVEMLKRLKTPVLLQLVAGTLLYVAGYTLLGFSTGAIAVASVVAIITLGEITVQPALYTSIAAETRPDNAGRLFSVYSLMRGIGYSIGPWIGAQLYENCKSPQVMWGVLASFATAATIAFLFTRRNSNSATI